MTDTANLGLPLIEGGQAQKHVTHNEALRILDAAIQMAVADRTRTAPPPSPAEGQRHIVAAGASGAWSGRAQQVATWQNGAWSFLGPRAGWCVWSIADDVLFVFDGAAWRDLRDLPVSLDNAGHIGVNTTAAAPNLLSVKSNAALLTAIPAAEGGSGDVRMQLSKESAFDIASVVFSNAYSGRAEFGLVGSDAFQIKVSADGAAWLNALSFDAATGGATLPRAVSLSGVVSPPTLTANQNDYAPSALAGASVLQLATDASRSIGGLAGGSEGRILVVINVGSQPIVLLDEAASSAAANRFALGAPLMLLGRQAAVLRYDGAAARWLAIAASASAPATAPQGRLTLQSGVPVMTTSQAGKTTLYYTPAAGNSVPVFDGAAFRPFAFAELSAATTDATKSPAALGASKNNDWFVWLDGGALRLSHGPDWTDANTRSAGTALQIVNGLWLNAASISNGPAALRGTYVGTTRSNASATLDYILGGATSGGSAASLMVWNAWNRRVVTTRVSDTGAAYTYTSSTPRMSRASAGNQIGFVVGFVEDAISADGLMFVQLAAAAHATLYGGIGLNSSGTTFDLARQFAYTPTATAIYVALNPSGSLMPALGHNVIALNEAGDGANANTLNYNGGNQLSALLSL